MIDPYVVTCDEWRTWEPGLPTAEREVCLWWLDLQRLPLGQASLESLLTPAESAEVARFLRPEDRLQRAGARAFLRFVLGTHYLGCPPREVRWTRDPHGRPQLTGDGAGSLDFNLSHAGSHVLVGVSTGGRIGVDIEIVSPVEVTALARICATESEQRWLVASGDDEEARNRFFRLWTMKEAVLKSHGLGLGFDPRHCELEPERGAARFLAPAQSTAPFKVVPLPFGSGVFGAVAWPGEAPRSLRLWRARDDWIVA